MQWLIEHNYVDRLAIDDYKMNFLETAMFNLSNYPLLADIALILGVSMEASFILAFFTRRFDYYLIVIGVIFHLITTILVDVSFLQLWILFVVFIPMKQIEKTLVAFLVILVFCSINYIGVKKASAYNKLSSSTKIGGLLFFAVIGLIINGNDFSRLGEIKTVQASLGPIGNTIAALMLILFSFIGWDRVGYVAGEMKDPQKVIPQTMLVGMLIISVLYLSSNILYHTIIGLEQMRESTIVASDTAVKLFGPIGAAMISLMVIISATGSINGTIMSASRVYYAMAKDKLLFAWLDHIHPKHQTPTHAIVAHGLWAAVLIIIRQNFETIVSGMVFAVLIFYGFTTIAFFKFRNENAGKDNGYKLFGYPWIPSLYLIGIILLVVLRSFYEFESSVKDLCFIVSGIPIYFILFKNQPVK